MLRNRKALTATVLLGALFIGGVSSPTPASAAVSNTQLLKDWQVFWKAYSNFNVVSYQQLGYSGWSTLWTKASKAGLQNVSAYRSWILAYYDGLIYSFKLQLTGTTNTSLKNAFNSLLSAFNTLRFDYGSPYVLTTPLP